MAGGFANSISFLLVTRIIQGAGLAAIPAAFSLLRDTFPPAKLSIAVGIFGSAYSAGSVVGLLVGASIIQAFGWHATFLIVPFSILVTLLISKIVKENTRSGQSHKSIIEEKASNNKRKAFPVDIRGILALSATIFFFLVALTLIQIGVNNENLLLCCITQPI